MGILETIKSFLAMRPESIGKENTMAEEKKMTHGRPYALYPQNVQGD
jgi:hypothetical protein